VLPLLALIAAQFQIGCSESGCPLWRDAVGLLAVPLAIGWLATLALLAPRGLRRERAGAPRERERPGRRS
jgi:hypothetical protein